MKHFEGMCRMMFEADEREKLILDTTYYTHNICYIHDEAPKLY